jgi:UDP-glucose 4-epimerase
MIDQVLEDYDRAYGLKSVCPRHFNAAGADWQGWGWQAWRNC